jgi:hypothetical protein
MVASFGVTVDLRGYEKNESILPRVVCCPALQVVNKVEQGHGEPRFEVF